MPIVLFHKGALSRNDGMGGGEGGAVWIWKEDLCVCVSVCVPDSHAESSSISLVPCLDPYPPGCFCPGFWSLVYLVWASLHTSILGLLPGAGHRLGTST